MLSELVAVVCVHPEAILSILLLLCCDNLSQIRYSLVVILELNGVSEVQYKEVMIIDDE